MSSLSMKGFLVRPARDKTVAVNLGGIRTFRRFAGDCKAIVCQVQLSWVVQVIIFFGCIEWQMRFGESAGDEERLIFAFHPPQVFDGLFGCFAVIVGIVRDIGHFTKRAASGFWIDGFSGLRIQPDFVEMVSTPVAFFIGVVIIHTPGFLAPAIGTVGNVVKNLAIGDGMVAIIFEMFGQRDRFGGILVGTASGFGKAGRVTRPDSRHQAGP